MEISKKQLASPPKKVGLINGVPIFYIVTKGGLSMMMATSKGGGHETLGAGSHPAIARATAERIASKTNRSIQWTELSKSEWLPLEAYQHLIPKYEEETNQIRAMQGY